MKDLGLLSSFVEAADCSSFTEAARRLMLTPATVSRNIARLEEELGTRLFNRTTRMLHLTDDGRLYLESVKSALTILEESEASLISAGRQPSGVLRVALPVPFSITYVMPRLEKFLETNERILLEIGFEDVPVDPVRDGYDLVIRNGAPQDGSHIIRRLCEEQQVLVASPEYLSAHGVPRHPEDLSHHLCIAMKDIASQTHTWNWRPQGNAGGSDLIPLSYNPHTRLRIFGHSYGGTDAAIAGLGIAAISHVHVRHLLEDGRLKTIMPDFQFVDETGLAKIYAVYPHRKLLPPKVRIFLDFLADAIREEEAIPFDAFSFAA